MKTGWWSYGAAAVAARAATELSHRSTAHRGFSRLEDTEERTRSRMAGRAAADTTTDSIPTPSPAFAGSHG